MSSDGHGSGSVISRVVAVAVTVLTVGLVISGSLAGGSPRSVEPWTPGTESGLTGAQLYGFACASCHGASLEGGDGPKLGRGSEAVDHSDDEIVEVIFGGEGDMPALTGAITPDQAREIVAYLRTVQAG